MRPGGYVQESKGKKRMVELAEEDFGEAMQKRQVLIGLTPTIEQSMRQVVNASVEIIP